MDKIESPSNQKIPSNVRLEKNLSWTKRLKVQIWDDQLRVDIRTYEDNFQRPLKKGVSLSLARYKILTQYYDLLTEALGKAEKRELGSRVSYHLGGGVYASVTPGWSFVDLRQYFVPDDGEGELHPTKRGIMLNGYEWVKLMNSAAEIEEADPELDTTITCLEDLSHCNQLGALECKECHPFADKFQN